jgi:hypothetical protein
MKPSLIEVVRTQQTIIEHLYDRIETLEEENEQLRQRAE